MASITIRKLDADLKRRLRIQAAVHGRSMEDEARDILRVALAEEEAAPQSLVEAIRRRFRGLDADDLEIRDREASREPPRFDE